tara:strand:- start:754 stop:1611 length:858 start_codon:yes stop_codon:yes gene_type:complete
MPNILKRPMFSRGGASQGTGITSGLGRQNFEEKGSAQTTPNPELDDKKAMIDYVSQLKKQAQPTTRQRIGDFLTAFGASKGLDLGASLADTGKNFAALSAKRQDRADKYNAVLDSQLLKLFGSSETLTAARKNAKEFARLNYKNFPGKTDQEKYMAAYRTQFNKILNKEKAATSFSERVLKIKNELKDEGVPVSYRNQTATIIALIEDGKIKDKAGNVFQYDGFIGVDDRGLSDIMAVSEEIFQINPKVKGVMESDYVIGNNYLDPKTGGIFRYEGRKKFRKVYP